MPEALLRSPTYHSLLVFRVLIVMPLDGLANVIENVSMAMGTRTGKRLCACFAEVLPEAPTVPCFSKLNELLANAGSE